MLFKKYGKEREVITRTIMPIGMLLVCISILLSQFGPDLGILAFFEGLFIGIACPLLMLGIYLTARESRESRNKSEETNNNR